MRPDWSDGRVPCAAAHSPCHEARRRQDAPVAAAKKLVSSGDEEPHRVAPALYCAGNGWRGSEDFSASGSLPDQVAVKSCPAVSDAISALSLRRSEQQPAGDEEAVAARRGHDASTSMTRG